MHAHTKTDLLHFWIEVGVAICDYELDRFIGYLFIRGFHGDAPNKIHPCQVKTLHTLITAYDTLNALLNMFYIRKNTVHELNEDSPAEFPGASDDGHTD